MKKRFAGILSALLACLFLLPAFSVAAIRYEGAPEITSNAGVVYNLDTGEILCSKNMDGRLDPAAFTKLMTALLAFEYYGQNGNVQVTVTAEMLSSAGGNSMRLKEGEIIPFDSLLSGLVVQNANDAALCIASTVGGNVIAFVDMMNERAGLLGMKNTYFSNPTGVDSAAMYTTMQDVLTLCKALYRVNDFMLLAETEKVSIPATNLTAARSYTNKNALIPYSYVTDYYLEDVRGMIAGYTPRAGYCVATVRELKGSKTLVILSGGVDRSERGNGTDISSYREAKALLEWAEGSFGMRRVMERGTVACERKVRLASGVDHMILVTGESLDKLLPLNADLSTEITTEIRTQRDTYTAPIIEGTTYGEMDVLYQGEVIGTVPLVAKSNIGLSRWLVAWDAVVRFFSHGPAKVVLILVICGIVLYIAGLIYAVCEQNRRKNREKNRAIKEALQIENQRMKKVRERELLDSQKRMRKMRSALRAGFQVLNGDDESLDRTKKARGNKKAPPSKAVAKVPEKYRAANRRPAQSNLSQKSGKTPSSGMKREAYRTGRPARPSQAKRPVSRPSATDPRKNGNGKK